MPQPTVLRRVSTLMVGALFAVVFVCSGASATPGIVIPDGCVIGAHTSTSKAAARTIDHEPASHKAQSPAPLHLATTGPTSADDSPVLAVSLAGGSATTHHSFILLTTSERAPPAL